MSKYEEKAFPVGKTKPTLAGLKSQLSRLKEDLGQFMARKPGGAVVAPLRERIRELEAEIAAAEEEKQREKHVDRGGDDGPEGSMRPTGGRFPARRR